MPGCGLNFKKNKLNISLEGNSACESSLLNTMRYLFSEGAGDLILGKWKSVMEHICDRHEDFEDATFQQCQHGVMEGYNWIELGTFCIADMYY